MKGESREESENTRITNKIVRQEDSEITRLIFNNYSEILDLRNPGNQRVNALKRVIGREEKFKREKSMERECSGETRVLKVGRENSRRGNSVARIADTEITDAGIADAGFASHRCHKREVYVQVRTRGERGRGCGFCVTRGTQTRAWAPRRINTGMRGLRKGIA